MGLDSWVFYDDDLWWQQRWQRITTKQRLSNRWTPWWYFLLLSWGFGTSTMAAHIIPDPDCWSLLLLVVLLVVSQWFSAVFHYPDINLLWFFLLKTGLPLQTQVTCQQLMVTARGQVKWWVPPIQIACWFPDQEFNFLGTGTALDAWYNHQITQDFFFLTISSRKQDVLQKQRQEPLSAGFRWNETFRSEESYNIYSSEKSCGLNTHKEFVLVIFHKRYKLHTRNTYISYFNSKSLLLHTWEFD